MSEPEESKKVRPWEWPFIWALDEKFWRDVASRAIAGLIVVSSVAVIGFASGVLAVPDESNPWWRLFRSLVWTGAVLPIMLFANWLSDNRRSRFSSIFVIVVYLIAVAGTLLLVLSEMAI
jgi:putative copper export protein